jgi:hypothetical protein
MATNTYYNDNIDIIKYLIKASKKYYRKINIYAIEYFEYIESIQSTKYLASCGNYSQYDNECIIDL